MLAVALGFKLSQHIENHGDRFFSEHRVLSLTPEQSDAFSKQLSASLDSREVLFTKLKASLREYLRGFSGMVRKVLSYHHQAVDWASNPQAQADVLVTDISLDGVIEGLKHKNGLIFGNQYHVEYMKNDGLPEPFAYLLRRGLEIERSPRGCSRAHSY